MNDTNQNEIKADDVNDSEEINVEPSAVSTTAKERFIPVTRYALMERLQRPQSWPPGIFDDAMATLQSLAAWRHQIYAQRLNVLMESYLPFSPDRDTVRVIEYSDEELLQKRKSLIKRLAALLERANYEEVSHEELDDFFVARGPYDLNLKVDMDEYDEVLVFYRGSDTTTTERRDWKRLYLKKIVDVIPVFQRLFLLLKLKPEEVRVREIMQQHGVSEKKAQKMLRSFRKNLPEEVSTDHVYLKTFKNIPQADLEMLFPNTKIEFKMFDKIKFIATAGGGTIGGIVGTASKLAVVSNPLTALLALGGFAGVLFRQVSNFFNQRNRYMMTLAQNLYFHSLANNRGALTLLLDRAEEEDIKEEYLLYSYLVHAPIPPDRTEVAKTQIENFLKNEFGVDIEYDFEDALDRLRTDSLITEDEQGVIRAVEPARAKVILAEKWSQVLPGNNGPNPTQQNSNAA